MTTPCFAVSTADGRYPQVWAVEEEFAWRVGVDDPTAVHAHHVALEGPTGFADAVKQRLQTYVSPEPWIVRPMRLGLGQHHVRMARPDFNNPGREATHLIDGASHKRAYVLLVGQMDALIARARETCRHVYPAGPALAAYGDEIRNLLILACTEAESQWRSVLTANCHSARCTRDYVKLRGAMKLDDYAITFPRYPDMPPVRPFDGWGSTDNPTKDLFWYDAYNAVKHHREANFAEGTLGAAIHAVAACAVMLFAQFGTEAALRAMDGFVSLDARPTWDLTESYVRDRQDTQLIATPYPFEV